MEKIFNYVPHWISSGLRDRTCMKCHTEITRKDIIAVGVRQANDKHVIYVEHACPKCKWREMTNFDRKKTSIEELCYILLEGIRSRKNSEKSRQIEAAKSHGSQMSDKEVKSFLDFMNSNNSHEEFMKHIKADHIEGTINEQHTDEG